jgi:hypothetical protein
MSPAGTLVMAKRGPGRPKRNERELVTVKVDRAMAAKAKAIATNRGTSVAEVLSELLEVPLDRAYAQMLRDLEHGGKKGGER